ncbi:MAG TPA: hypothetical protein VGU02_05455 [Gaiellaceae bacterium]|nr:hypothetical protein [Gaiellaceae bacterium]
MSRARRRPEELLGEWGVRDVTPQSQRERRLVEADRGINPLVGNALPRRIRAFRADAANYLASMGGPLPYMQRLRQIEAMEEAHERRLAEAYAANRGDWRAVAERWDFEDVNELIDKHNRWFPMEARLPMDPKTRDFVKVGGKSYRRDPLDAAWILERFPAR